MNNRALIAMSGGVDSSVAALIMKQRGYDCTGVTMKLYNNDDVGISNQKTCCSLEDIDDARSVAFKLDIPYFVFNFTENFKDEVIDRFIKSYETGLTPNPCIDCNRYIKYEKLFLRAKQLDFNYVVTGHYARIEKGENGRYILKKAVDETKDQSYVLYSMTQEQLEHTIFPLGEYKKTKAREIAEQNGLINARKHDSQDICFVPDGDYAAFIENSTGKKYSDGNFIDLNGNILGKHKGIIRYTIGQRKGLGLSLEKPMYVCAINIEDNTVTLCEDKELYSNYLTACDLNFIAVEKIDKPMRVKAKIRYKHTEQWATVSPIDKNRIAVLFDEPQRAITKGQAVVFYDGDIVVGGGTIE